MRREILFGLLTCCAWPSPYLATLGFAQAGSQEEPVSAYLDVVEVEIANIDVWVHDQNGDPVTGLTAEEFVVLRDGRPVEVSNFYAVEDGAPAGTNAAAEPASAEGAPQEIPPPTLPDRRLEPEVAPEHRLWLIVYIDNFNIDSIERKRILPDLWLFLGRTLSGSDQAMIVTYDRKLEVRHPFTSNTVALQRAIEETADDTGFAQVRQRQRFDTLKRIDNAGSAARALLYAKQYAEEQMNAVDHTVDALGRLIQTLGGLPGRKVLLHVSSGIPMSAGEEMFHAVAEKFGGSEAYAEIPRHDTSRRFESVSRNANAHRVAFYTVDAGGFKAFEFGSAEYSGFVGPKLRQALDSVVPENLQAPLRLVALETGGQAILNQNNILPALESAARDFRSFYSLGIPSSSAETGRYHRIEVQLRSPDRKLSLRHRPGYRSKTLDTRVREMLNSALLYSQESNPLGIDLSWGVAEKQSDGSYLLPIRIQIPLRDIAVLPRTPGSSELSLRLFYGAVGEEAGTSEIDSGPLGLRLADEHVEAAKKEALVHPHKLRLTGGRKKIGVAVVDLFGREIAVLTRFVQVGPPIEED